MRLIRRSTQDYRVTAKETEKEYQKESKNRWYNSNKPSSLLPIGIVLLTGLSSSAGFFFLIANELDSLKPKTEIIRKIKITKNEQDSTIPANVIQGIFNRKKIELRNTNSPLEKKINASEIQDRLKIGETYNLEVSHPKNYPLKVYGNILDIK